MASLEWGQNTKTDAAVQEDNACISDREHEPGLMELETALRHMEERVRNLEALRKYWIN